MKTLSDNIRPKVSLILPIYNGERFLSRALDSILSQSLKEIEVICINDVSKDRTGEILAEYAAKDQRVKLVLHEVNKGHGAARNTGIKLAQGDYFFHIDPDDTLPEGALETLYNYAIKHDSDLVRGCYQTIIDGKKKRVLGKLSTKAVINTNIHDFKVLQNVPNGHWLGLYAARVFKSVFYTEDIPFAYDMVFLADVYLAAKTITIIPDVVYYYHDNPFSVMNSNVSLRKVYGDLIWRKVVSNKLKAANFKQASSNKFISSSNYVVDTFWKPMVNELPECVDDYFDFYKNMMKELEITPWNQNTNVETVNVLKAVLAGEYDEAKSLLGSKFVESSKLNSADQIKDEIFEYQPYLDSPKVSVIIPIYNTEKYLKECIDSVINQDLADIEIICVNDCSPDNSQSILEEYAKVEPRVIIVKHEVNKGLTSARNSGVAAAKGKYLRHLDSDDWIPSDTLSSLYAIAEKNNSDVVRAGGRTFINDEVQAIKRHHMPFSDVVDKTTYRDCSSLWSFSGCPFYFFKREFVQKNGLEFPVGIFHHEDYIFLSKALPLAKNISLLPKSCYNYRILPRKVTYSGALEQAKSIQIIKDNLVDLPLQRDYFLNYMRQAYCELLHNVKKNSKDKYHIIEDIFKDIYGDIPLFNQVDILWNTEFEKDYIVKFFKDLQGSNFVVNNTNSQSNQIKNSVIKTLQEEVEELKYALEDLNGQIVEKEKENEVYSHRLNDVFHSYSWKITKPIRWVTKKIRGY